MVPVVSKKTTVLPGPQTELRVYLLIQDLQRQFAAYLGTPTRARGYPALEGSHSLIVEVVPGLAIERIIDLALKSVPSVEPGLLFVERQFGILEIHSNELSDVKLAGQTILDGLNASESDQLKPHILFSEVVEDITDMHAIILNRTRQASMVLPGETLLLVELTPALFATVAANEAERVVPENTLVDVQMIGATGRVYISGTSQNVERARQAITAVLASITGRSQ